MSFKISSLASGSKGNSILVSNGKTNILVDAGISFSRIKRGLQDFNLSVEDLNGVVITHEHSDHIAGLPMLSKCVKIFAHEKTANAIVQKGKMTDEAFCHVDYFENGFNLGDIFVSPFRIPHDAVYPLAYAFYSKGQKIAVATDIGHANRGVLNNLTSCNILFLEANHDEEMLRTGKYPEMLKKRILGDNGHLSNSTSGKIVENVLGNRLERVILGHLSEENNTAKMAFDTVAKSMERCGVQLGKDVCLEVATQNIKTKFFEVER